MAEGALLDVQHLNAWWGGNDAKRASSGTGIAQALFDVSLQVRQGELVVLQGLNGAGKSTLLQAIMGIGPRVTGIVSYKNSSVSDWPAHRRAQAGLGFVAEDRRLFTALTVQDNLHIASGLDAAAREAMVLALFPALKTMLKRRASQMSGGEQQMLAVARTLMASPTLLLLDEPCEGIAPVLVEAMAEALLQLRAQGMTLLVAEQNRILADRADRVITLAAGQVQN